MKVEKFENMKAILILLLSVALISCLDSSGSKESFDLKFKLKDEIDTLFYKVEYKPYRIDSLWNGFTRKIYICLSKSNNDSLIGIYKSLTIKNDSIYRNEDRFSMLKENKQLDSVKIRTWAYLLFFNLPSEKVYENYEWTFPSPILINNIHEEDFEIISKGYIKKVYTDSSETYLDIEYKIEASRDVDGKNYPENPLMSRVRVKDERLVVGKGTFMLKKGRWKHFEIFQSFKNYYPNQDQGEENIAIEFINSKPY